VRELDRGELAKDKPAIKKEGEKLKRMKRRRKTSKTGLSFGIRRRSSCSPT